MVDKSVISDKKTNCNLGSVLLVLAEQLIITATQIKFSFIALCIGLLCTIRTCVRQCAGKNIHTEVSSQCQACSVFPLTYHNVTGASAVEV